MLGLDGSGRQIEKNGRLQHDLLAVISFHSRVMMLLPTGDSDWQRSNGRFSAMLGGKPEVKYGADPTTCARLAQRERVRG
jgi:hypothetical protein